MIQSDAAYVADYAPFDAGDDDAKVPLWELVESSIGALLSFVASISALSATNP